MVLESKAELVNPGLTNVWRSLEAELVLNPNILAPESMLFTTILFYLPSGDTLSVRCLEEGEPCVSLAGPLANLAGLERVAAVCMHY